MSKAVVDPSELRRFAGNLKQFNAEIGRQLALLNSQFASLGESWRDQEHDRFADQFHETMRMFQKFVEVSQQHIPFLLRKAERIEEYLQQR